LFDIDSANNNDDIPKANVHYTMVFTAFVSMTLFNELNARKVHGERNVFRGILNNYIFIAIWVGTFIITVSILSTHGNDSKAVVIVDARSTSVR